MRLDKRIVLAAALCAAIVTALSSAPLLDKLAVSQSAYAWQHVSGSELTERNLVDYMAGLPLQLRVRKVELNHSILSVDLLLPGSAEPRVVYGDLYRLAQSSLQRTSNISRVLIRVLEYDRDPAASGPQLVIAMEAAREQAKRLAPAQSFETQQLLAGELKRRFQLTYTKKWQQRYPE
ncbi:hypothetical protein [Paenibacillus lutrae]|uniref:DUF4390 domain-containing protein n=1 Tax=Paenibacillus lutrae TaxID=2078573 RepID=A0A7X3FHT4_9BACL|nr:hypothetical protein [Paenibacillus lutrae]MVP00046.1 hypothetical protein [Paenibacillus lutrae]